MNEQMMQEAHKRAASGGRRSALKRFQAKVARNSFGSSPGESPVKDKLEDFDFSNSYVANRPRSRCLGDNVEDGPNLINVEPEEMDVHEPQIIQQKPETPL